MKKLLFSIALLSSIACTNQMTPEGHEGYLVHRPLAFGQAHFVGGQVGPTSTGLVWRQYVVNVDMRPKNYTEEFHILSRDNLNVGFEANARIGLRAGSVRHVVEEFGADEATSGQELPAWYLRNVRQAYRTAVRDVVHGFEAYDIQRRTQEIGNDILERLRETFAGTPIEVESISIGNLTYPEEINREIQRKLAAEQDLERMQREEQIAQQEAEIMVANARGRAAAQRVVNETLTPLYVQHEMLVAFQALSRSPRATVLVVPMGESSSAPVILQLPQAAPQAPP
jgi:regulator of protease activity HflC (stomatin/prohibitin superfamily)